MTQKLNRTLEDYFDRCFVYSILLNKSYSYYSRLRTLFKIPIILTSSVMSLINSNLGSTDDNVLKIVNITFNILTALILSLGSTLKIEEKAQVFLSAEKKFLKLTSIIEQKIISDEDIGTDFVNNIMNMYDGIVETIDYDVPKFICNSVRKEYATKKTLPLIINGILKKEEMRSPNNRSISYLNRAEGKTFGALNLKTKMIYNDIENNNNISPIISPKLPSVLITKPHLEENV